MQIWALPTTGLFRCDGSHIGHQSMWQPTHHTIHPFVAFELLIVSGVCHWSFCEFEIRTTHARWSLFSKLHDRLHGCYLLYNVAMDYGQIRRDTYPMPRPSQKPILSSFAGIVVSLVPPYFCNMFLFIYLLFFWARRWCGWIINERNNSTLKHSILVM